MPMARDPMLILRTVRRRSVEEARYALGACLTAEAAAAARLRAVDDAARRDRAAHGAVDEGPRFLEMFVLRLQVYAVERAAAEAALTAAQAASAEARAAVVAARTAAEAVETLIADRVAAAEVEAGRREQHALDDMSRPRFNSTGCGSAGGGR